jgi:multiple sugar transport system permease protein
VVAYGFSRFRFPGRSAIFLLMLSTMMIPYAITLIPQYIIFSKIGWVNTFLPLTVPSYFGGPYFIFLLRQFFMTIPYDLDEAARIDGAGNMRILWQVLLPEIRPAILAMAVLTFIGTWQDFLAPLIYLQDSNLFTIEVGLAQFYNSVSGQPRWDLLTSVALVSMIPMVVLFFISSRYIVRGVTMSGMGGA